MKPQLVKKFFLLSMLLSSVCSLTSYTVQSDSTKGLKDYYQNHFPIGVAIKPTDIKGSEQRIVLQHFNSITAENAMKMEPLQPEENQFYWDSADSLVSFAIKNKLQMRGHCLVWHTQAPTWLFKHPNGKSVNKEILLRRLQSHINAVVGRYKGKIYAWDVVNEVIADDTATYRKSALFEIAGEEFIEKSFQYAHQADPMAILFYNDYNTEEPAKREKIYRMLKRLLSRGVPIHGIGLQAHWSINTPSREELEKSIQIFSSLGLAIQFTELDVSVYPGNQGGQILGKQKDSKAAVFTEEMERKQLDKYKMAFEVFRKYKKNITGVTFWNVSDKYSWLDNRGKKNYPLLFDSNLQPKKVYYEVIKF